MLGAAPARSSIVRKKLRDAALVPGLPTVYIRSHTSVTQSSERGTSY
jgi:hypothetical protein